MTVYRKLYEILERRQRIAAAVLLGLMLVGMVLEAFGIGMVIPALTVLSRPELAREYLASSQFAEWAGTLSDRQLVLGGVLILVVAYVVKTLFLIFLAWRQARFVFGVQEALSRRMFEGYLYRPYTFHLQHNSSVLIRNVVTEVQQLALTVLAGANLLTETLVMLGIAALLLAVEPVGAVIVMAAFAVTGGAFYAVSRSRVLRWGEARQKHEGQRIRHLQQGFGGIKQARLAGREDYFLDQYALHNSITARVTRLVYFVQTLPRLLLELLAVLGLAALVLGVLVQGRQVTDLIPTLGLFAAAAFRLMPSANRLLASLNSLRHALPVVNVIHAELFDAERVEGREAGAPRRTFDGDIEMRSISYSYADESRIALKDVSISIPGGSCVGICGASGAGKSTLVDVMLGLLTPDSGVIEVGGRDIGEALRDWQLQIGYVPQAIYLTDDTLRKNVAFGVPDDEIDEQAVRDAISAAQLEDFVADLPEGLETFVGEAGVRLSGGQRQRIGIARALYGNPSLLVLDEASSALDNETEREVMQAVNTLRGEKTIVIIAHRLTTIENCDIIYRLEKGAVAGKGTYEQLFKPGSEHLLSVSN